jgi:signal transduction histidine kinase
MLMQWISYFMIFSVLVIFILEYPLNGTLDWRFYGTVLALGMLLVLNILWFQAHPSPKHAHFYAWAFNIVTNLLVLGAFALTGRGEVIFLVFMQAAQFAAMFGVWPGGAVYSVVTLGFALGILKAYGITNEQLIQTAAQFMAGMLFILVFVLLESRSAQETRRAEGLLKDLQAANAALKAAHQKEKDLAIAEERVRLARDIHDGLGHHLTVLSIQLQAAEKLVERNPQAAAEAIQISRGEAQAALEEVRRSVGVMRQPAVESQPLVDMIANLVHDFNEHTGLQSTFDTIGTPVALSPFANETLFRTVQESLTNVQKHARGVMQIQVRLEYSAEAIRLAVSDDGQKPDVGFTSQGGYGLEGLRERVDQLGGDYCFGPGEDKGFQVDVTLPLDEVGRDKSTSGR